MQISVLFSVDYLRKEKNMVVKQEKNHISVTDFGEINLDLTLDCGQAFRWRKDSEGIWHGVAYGKSVGVKSTEKGLAFFDTDLEAVENIWLDYFDLKRDYSQIIAIFKNDEHVRSAIEKSGTVHILNQEPWEALCTFIISACNNIPRIKGIVERMCVSFGERLGNGEYAFPSAKALAEKTPEDFSVLRCGYRAPYLFDAAMRVSSGETDLESIKILTEENARRELMKIKGVGQKVADCTLLFSLGFSDVFPTDRHIKRACAEFYPQGLPECLGSFKGLAQQYIFDTQRNK